jgi:hypothetical protein
VVRGRPNPPNAACGPPIGLPVLATLHPPTAPSSREMGRFRSVQSVLLHAETHKHRLTITKPAQAMAALPDTSPRLKAAFAKWNGLFARLALTFHLIEIADTRASDMWLGMRPASSRSLPVTAGGAGPRVYDSARGRSSSPPTRPTSMSTRASRCGATAWQRNASRTTGLSRNGSGRPAI